MTAAEAYDLDKFKIRVPGGKYTAAEDSGVEIIYYIDP